jgi:hypothetical protein
MVSQYISDVSMLYFGLFNPLHYSSLPFTSHPLFFNSFKYICLYSLPSQILLISQYYGYSIIPIFFPSFLEFHRVVLLLLKCSTYEFVYDHVWFCVCVYLLDLSSMYERKHVAFVFLILANFTYHDVLQLHPITFKPYVIIPCG